MHNIIVYNFLYDRCFYSKNRNNGLLGIFGEM
jgi:hypothetical protein